MSPAADRAKALHLSGELDRQLLDRQLDRQPVAVAGWLAGWLGGWLAGWTDDVRGGLGGREEMEEETEREVGEGGLGGKRGGEGGGLGEGGLGGEGGAGGGGLDKLAFVKSPSRVHPMVRQMGITVAIAAATMRITAARTMHQRPNNRRRGLASSSPLPDAKTCPFS